MTWKLCKSISKKICIISERPLWPSSCEPQLEVTQSQSQNQSPSPSQTLRLMDSNFFTSYIRCLTTSWSKLLSTPQCFTACGQFIGTLPTHSLYKLPMKWFTISKIFFDHLDLIHLNWVISQARNMFHINKVSDKLFSMLQCSPTWLPLLAGLQKRQSKKTLLLTPAGMQ